MVYMYIHMGPLLKGQSGVMNTQSIVKGAYHKTYMVYMYIHMGPLLKGQSGVMNTQSIVKGAYHKSYMVYMYIHMGPLQFKGALRGYMC